MTPKSTNRLTMALSTWLLVAGVWGMTSPVVLEVFTTNRMHAVVHLALGVWGLKTAFTHGARGFLWACSVVLLLTGALFFIPGGRALTDFLAINRAMAVLNLALGAGALISAGRSPR